MIAKEDLLKFYKKEFATTLKVIKAFPENQLDFTPHEKSKNARQLMVTFIFEMYLLEMYVFGKKVDRSVFQTYLPDNLRTIVTDFEKETADVIKSLEKLPENYLAKSFEFAGKKFVADEFMLMMVCDQIHHRGQLSVYVRMAGGKVPSIYGPSADDPSTNL